MTPRRGTEGHPAAPRLPTGVEQPLSAAMRERIGAYLDLLAKWNRVYNLTAIRDRAQMELHHVDDALAILPYLPDREALRVLDVGSGGGVPGIPLAIARPGWKVTLLDANHKKVAFLTQAVIELGLSNARAVASRVEDLADDEMYDVVISRAFADLGTFARLAAPYVAREGALVAMKGALPQDEIDALPPYVGVTSAPKVTVPGLDAERHLVIMRVADGPAR
jgi:16S rRNA (guanine527-N7)-methyltransferase